MHFTDCPELLEQAEVENDDDGGGDDSSANSEEGKSWGACLVNLRQNEQGNGWMCKRDP